MEVEGAQAEVKGAQAEGNDLDFDPTAAPILSLTSQMASLDLNYSGSRTEKEVINDEQQELAISQARRGENLFLTGRAGTGKSWTTMQIVKSLQQDGKVVHVTAPTMIAAVNVGGTTIHRWGGFGLGVHYSDYNMMMSRKNKTRVKLTDVLVVDEISMMSGHMYDVLECMVTIVRNYEDVKCRLKNFHGDGQNDNELESGDSLYVNPRVLEKRWESYETLSDGYLYL